MTGRAAGYCADYGVPGYANHVPGAGMGWGGGWGRGCRHRHWYHATGLPGWVRFGYSRAWGRGPYGAVPTPEQQAEALKVQADWLEKELEAIKRRLAELEESE